jgi:hypothetical protein
MNDGAALAQFSARAAATIDAARKLDGLAPHADALHAQLQRLQQVTRTLWSAGDPLLTLANASVYLEAFGHIVIAWIWLQQAAAAHGKDSDFHHGKRQAAQYFFAWELPKVNAQFDLLASFDRSTLDMRDSWF